MRLLHFEIRTPSEEAWGRRGVCDHDGFAWPCDTELILRSTDGES